MRGEKSAKQGLSCREQYDGVVGRGVSRRGVGQVSILKTRLRDSSRSGSWSREGVAGRAALRGFRGENRVGRNKLNCLYIIYQCDDVVETSVMTYFRFFRAAIEFTIDILSNSIFSFQFFTMTFGHFIAVCVNL
jgi:hypothetical protein